ncbi:MAG: type I methionyl aminopeptidase [Chloroflexota bacterium]|nr:type I methionyl aminopeptidase [Chloroflexota bacterium]
MGVLRKSQREIAAMKQAGKVVALVLKKVAGEVRVGIRTRDLEAVCIKELAEYDAQPSFKGYHGFPGYLCVSVNEEVVHGIAGDRVLKNGDIVSLDFGAIVNGLHGDAALTVGVGRISSKAEELMKVTEQALYVGIDAAREGSHLGDISSAVQSYVEEKGFSVVREYTGHGIGYKMHEEPQIPNFGREGDGPLLKRGMTFAIEPMVNIGGWQTRVLDNCWTVVTADGSLSAHFEHTIAITDGVPEILTRL